MDSAVDGNWIQECMDHDHRQDDKQGPLQKLAVDKEERESCDPPALN